MLGCEETIRAMAHYHPYVYMILPRSNGINHATPLGHRLFWNGYLILRDCVHMLILRTISIPKRKKIKLTKILASI